MVQGRETLAVHNHDRDDRPLRSSLVNASALELVLVLFMCRPASWAGLAFALMLCGALCVVLVKPLKQTNNGFNYVCTLNKQDRLDDVDQKNPGFYVHAFQKRFFADYFILLKQPQTRTTG